MKTQRNILIAFILNLSFCIFEFIGGIITGSVAIASDAVHDAGDAASIGISYFLEKKSKKKANKKYTYGYARYSVIGGFITTLILLTGSAVMIYNAVQRIITPTKINYNIMLIFAVAGVCVNLCAALLTRDGGSLNLKAINLHMIEDVLGWIVVLIGAVVMRFTDFELIDPIMSIGVSVFIIINALKNLIASAELLLEKVPENIDIDSVTESIEKIDGIRDVHHIHIWSMDEKNVFATMHVITDSDTQKIKAELREELQKYNINHITVETETSSEQCRFKECQTVHFEHPDHHYHCHHAH